MTANSFVDIYAQNFGPFINKFGLGGTISKDDQSMDSQKMREIE